MNTLEKDHFSLATFVLSITICDLIDHNVIYTQLFSYRGVNYYVRIFIVRSTLLFYELTNYPSAFYIYWMQFPDVLRYPAALQHLRCECISQNELS